MTIRSTWGPPASLTAALCAPALTIDSTERQRREALDHRRCVVRLDEEVQVADRVAPAPEGARRLHAQHAGDVAEQRRNPLDDPLGRPQGHPRRSAIDRLHARREGREPLLGEPRDAPERACPETRSQVVERLDPQPLPEQPHGLGPDARYLEELDEGRRHLAVEPVEEAETSGGCQLRDLVGDRRAHARDRGRVALAVGAGDLVRAVADRVGGAVVGDRLEDELALDLEEAADLVEDRRQLGVGEERDGIGGS